MLQQLRIPNSISKILVIVLLLAPKLCSANELSDANLDFCAKLKHCVGLEFAQRDGHQQMKASLSGVIDSMCQSMFESYSKKAYDTALEKKALTCHKDLLSLSCPDFMSGRALQQPSCIDLDNSARKAYPELFTD